MSVCKKCSVKPSLYCIELFYFNSADRWRAFQLIKSIPPADLPQVRAKVAAFANLKGQRGDLGLQRSWEGNYLATVSNQVNAL